MERCRNTSSCVEEGVEAENVAEEARQQEDRGHLVMTTWVELCDEVEVSENVGSREKNTEDHDGQDRGQLHLVVMIQQTVRWQLTTLSRIDFAEICMTQTNMKGRQEKVLYILNIDLRDNM